MSLRSTFAAVFLVLLSASFAHAFTLNDCLVVAARKDPALAAMERRVASAGLTQTKDLRSLLPSLSLGDEASYSAFKEDAGLANGMDNKANADLEWDLQRMLSAPQKQSELSRLRAAKVLKQAQTQLRLDVTRAFDHCRVASVRAAEFLKAVEFVDGHIHDIQRLQGMGMDVALDLLRAQSQRKSLDLAMNGNDAQLQDALSTLRLETGLDVSAKDFDAALAISLSEAPVAQDIESRLAQRLSGVAAAQLADLDLKSARLAYDASGFFSAPLVHVGLDHSFQAADPATPVDRAYGSLSLPVWDWGQRGLDSDRLKADLEAQGLDHEAQMRDLRLQAEQLASGLAHARNAYTISAAMVEDAAKGLGIAKTYYKQGKVKETDLLSVFSDYLGAQGQFSDALLDCLDKQAAWDAFWDGSQP